MKVDREGDQPVGGERERGRSVSSTGTNMRSYTCVYKYQNIANCFIYLEYTNKIKQVTVFYTSLGSQLIYTKYFDDYWKI